MDEKKVIPEFIPDKLNNLLFIKINSFKEGIYWAFPLLILFFTIDYFSITRNFWEWFAKVLLELVMVLIIVSVFTFFSWKVLNYSVRKNVEERKIRILYNNEIYWFFFFLTVFLSAIVIFGSPELSDVLIAGSAFTFIWLARSFLYKKYSNKNN